MKPTKFFRYLWRLNGLFIFVAALLAIVVLGTLAFEVLDFGGRNEQVIEVKNSQESKVQKPEMGEFSSIDGTPFLWAQLTFGNQYGGGSFSSSGRSYSVQNHLFLNSITLERRWLFPSNKQLLLKSELIQRTVDKKTGEKTTVAIFYEIISKDTNGDGKLTSDDKSAFGLTKPNGTDWKPVIVDVDRLLNIEGILNAESLVVIYEKDKKTFASKVNTRIFEVIQTSQIAMPAAN
jgi:hypothetical protein